jgi:hypothetical protein
MNKKETVTITRETEAYFRLMNAFLDAQALVLNETLKELDIKKPKRKEICQVFGLAMGQVYDEHWIGSNGKRYFPLLMFAEGFLTPEKSLSQVGAIHASPKTDEFHPLGVGAASDLFEEKNEKLPPEAMGTVTLEDSMVDSPPAKKKAPAPKKPAAKKSSTKKSAARKRK